MSNNKYKSDLVNEILIRDGDEGIRTRLKGKYQDMLNDLGSQIRPDIPITHVHPDTLSNSYYDPGTPLPKWLGGADEHIKSGIPSRAVVAHELGHANSIGKSTIRKIRRGALLGLAALSTGTYPALRAYTKLSKEQALGVSAAATLGLMGLHQWDVIDEEARASRNALKYLRDYNTTVSPNNRVDLDKAKDALDYARGTYKSWVIPSSALALLPTGLAYAYDKYKNK